MGMRSITTQKYVIFYIILRVSTLYQHKKCNLLYYRKGIKTLSTKVCNTLYNIINYQHYNNPKHV